MADYGIEVSEKDIDVQDAQPHEFILKSGQNIPKEFAKGKVTMSSAITSVSHDLGYTPQFLAWSVYPDYPDYEALDVVLLMTGNFDAGSANVDTADLNLIPAMAQGTTSDAKYYIFYENLDGSAQTAVFDSDEYGIETSVDDVDVQDANLFQKTFSSKKNTIKILEGSLTSTGSSNVDIAVEHGLRVIPGYMIFFKVGNGKWYSTWEKESVSGANVQVGAISESSNIYVQIRRTASCTVTVKIYAFVDPAN